MKKITWEGNGGTKNVKKKGVQLVHREEPERAVYFFLNGLWAEDLLIL